MADNISNVKVLADMKIMDAADYEVSQEAIKFYGCNYNTR